LPGFLTLGPPGQRARSQNKANRIAPWVDAEQQARNLNTKRTKRTKKKEIGARLLMDLWLNNMDNLLYESHWFPLSSSCAS
jgi:hypothetical protein